MVDDYDGSFKEYEWVEYEYGQLDVLATTEREAIDVIRKLQRAGETEHGDYLAGTITSLAERSDGKRWFIALHGSECWCQKKGERGMSEQTGNKGDELEMVYIPLNILEEIEKQIEG